MITHRRSPCVSGRRCFDSLESAHNTASCLSGRRRQKTLWPYECCYCRHWHLRTRRKP